MAFTFVPNPDGSFTEGDRQTNLDTGVEYIYVDGAWRALGPNIEDEFDTLDGRYVKLQDTTVLGDYYRLRGPNAAGTGTSTFQVIDEGEQKLYNIKTPLSSNTNWVANVEYVNDTVSNYLPLTGGTLTGQLNLDNKKIQVKDANGEIRWYAQGSGFCKSYDMFRVERDIDGPAFQARIGAANNAEIRTNGSAFFKGTVNMHNNKLINVLTPTTANDAANKSYVDTKAGNYLPLNGGTMTGHIYTPHNIFFRGGRIDASADSSSVLSNRGCLDIRSHAERPIIISSGSTYQPILAFYAYNSAYADNKEKTAEIKANGNAYFNNVYVQNEKLATEDYVDNAVTTVVTPRKYPGLRFKFGNETTAIKAEKFNYYNDGGLRLRISNTCLDYKWNDGGLDVDYSFSEGHRFSIYEELEDGSLKIIRTGTYNRMDYHADDVLMRVSSHQTNGSLNTTSIYHLCVSGLF